MTLVFQSIILLIASTTIVKLWNWRNRRMHVFYLRVYT